MDYEKLRGIIAQWTCGLLGCSADEKYIDGLVKQIAALATRPVQGVEGEVVEGFEPCDYCIKHETCVGRELVETYKCFIGRRLSAGQAEKKGE